MSAVYCPKCFRGIHPRGRITARSELDRHLREDHVQDGETIAPVPRLTDEQAKPRSYSDETCIVCGETVRDPGWGSSTSGGNERQQASAVAGDPIRTSRFWTKRKVELEISTWLDFGAIGAKHYYFKLEEKDDCPIILNDGFGDKKPSATVYTSLPWRDPGRGRRIDDEHNLFTREEAVRAAIKKYLAEFDCKTHYLVHHYAHETETKVLVSQMIRQKMRDGD
jgi:hypothetical protein